MHFFKTFKAQLYRSDLAIHCRLI